MWHIVSLLAFTLHTHCCSNHLHHKFVAVHVRVCSCCACVCVKYNAPAATSAEQSGMRCHSNSERRRDFSGSPCLAGEQVICHHECERDVWEEA